MKHSLTAIVALVAAAGLAGIAQAQNANTPSSTAPYSAPNPAPSSQTPATSATTPSTAPANPSTAPRAAAPQASAQPQAGANDFWSHNISQDEVRQAQQQLQAQGLYRGPIDGMVGSEMHRALARYQQQNGLRQTATLDEPTIGRLSSGPSPAAGAAMPPAGTNAPSGASTAPSGTTSPIGAGGTTSSTAPTTSTTQPVNR